MDQELQPTVEVGRYLSKTKILDFEAPAIQATIATRRWGELDLPDRVEQIYNFVKDEVKFGYNERDDIPASRVLRDGYGQCNTKANLFMALLRGVGVPNRLHGFTIHKALQKGALTGIWYKLAPRNILHSWVEVHLAGRWINLEGLILDREYLHALQQKFATCKTTFCGYGAYTEDLSSPKVNWIADHTYIQAKGINQNFGVFDTPDAFYSAHRQGLSPLKRWVYENYVRHTMNRKVDHIRRQGGGSDTDLP